MTTHQLFYYPYASFTNQQVALLKVAALYFDRLVILDPVGASWETVRRDRAGTGPLPSPCSRAVGARRTLNRQAPLNPLAALVLCSSHLRCEPIWTQA